VLVNLGREMVVEISEGALAYLAIASLVVTSSGGRTVRLFRLRADFFFDLLFGRGRCDIHNWGPVNIPRIKVAL
jgi:hypothetical protein